jgi:hypothetical protein
MFDRLVEAGHGIVKLLLLLEHAPEVEMCLGTPGFEFDGPSQAEDGLIKLPALLQNHAKMHVRGGVGGVKLDGAAKVRGGLLVAPGLAAENAEQVEGVEVLWIALQDQAVKLLGLWKAVGLVVLKGEFEGLGKGKLGHSRFA